MKVPFYRCMAAAAFKRMLNEEKIAYTYEYTRDEWGEWQHIFYTEDYHRDKVGEIRQQALRV